MVLEYSASNPDWTPIDCDAGKRLSRADTESGRSKPDGPLYKVEKTAMIEQCTDRLALIIG